jgi:hypothetical protein
MEIKLLLNGRGLLVSRRDFDRAIEQRLPVWFVVVILLIMFTALILVIDLIA